MAKPSNRSNDVKAGAFVLSAAAVLFFLLAGIAHFNPFGPRAVPYRTYFKFAGGLEPGSTVRVGGLKAGRVTGLKPDPLDPTRIEVGLEVQRGTNVNKESVASLNALGMLGEYYLEITVGKPGAELIEPNGVILSKETPQLSDLVDRIDGLTRSAEQLMDTLRLDVQEVSARAGTVLENLKDATNERNRKNLADVLSKSNTLITQQSPKIDDITTNLRASSARIEPFIKDLQETRKKIDDVLANVQNSVSELRPEVRRDLDKLAETLDRTQKLIDEVNGTVARNNDDVDRMIEDFRQSARNLKEFTEELKQRPYSLIRVKPKPDRRVPKQ